MNLLGRLMIFERYEIEEILKEISNESIKLKLKDVLESTIVGRFTIHNTDKIKFGDVTNVGGLLKED